MVSQDAVEAYAAFLERSESGEELEFEDFLAGHPACAPDLERLHQRRQALEGRLFAPRRPERTARERRDAREALQPVLHRLGSRVGFERRYRFLGQVQEGGMGRVVRVFDRDLRRVLVMKLLAGTHQPVAHDAEGFDAHRAARLLEEAQITAQLDHPGIPPIHEIGLTPEGELYFTMKWIASERTLADVIEELHGASGTEWTLPRVLALVQRACEAVAYAHEHGVIHRDLKPANVLIGDLGEVYVSDWGVAQALAAGRNRDFVPRPEPSARPVRSQRADQKRAQPTTPLRTLEGHTVGTPEYMSPEQARGRLDELDARSDVYSMGVLLLQVLTGRAPSPGGAQAEPRNHSGRSTPRVPAELEAIVARALAPSPADRYSDMRALVRDLAAFQEGRVVAAYRTGALAELHKWVRRNRSLATATGLTAAALLVGFVVSLGALRAEREQRARAQIQLAIQAIDKGDSRARTLLQAVPEGERHWEWRHLLARTDSSRSVFARHASPVARVFVRPNGQALSLSESGACDVWSPADGQELGRFETDKEVRAAALSGDGKWLATLGQTRLAVRDATDGSEHPTFAPRALPDGKRAGRAVAFSPDGTLLASLAADARVRVWGLDDDAQAEFPSAGFEHALAWVDGDRLVCAGSEGRLSVRNAHTGAQEREWKVPGNDIKTPILSLATHAPSKRIVCGDREGGIWLWSEMGVLEGFFAGHQEAVLALAFDPSGERIASGSADHSVRLWDRKMRTETAVWAGHEERVRDVAIDPTGTLVLSASEDRTVRVWSMDQEPGLTALSAARYPLWCLSFSPDSRRVAVGSSASDLSLWEVESSQRTATLRGHKNRINAVRWTGDGRQILTASADHTLALWDVGSLSRVRVFEGHASDVTGVDIAPGSQRFVSSSADRTLRTWDLTSGEQTTLHEDSSPLECVALSPDGSRIAAGTADGRLLYGGWTSLQSFPIDEKPIVCLAFSADGRLALGGDGGLFLWDPGEGRVERHWFPFDVIEGVAFSPDGTRLASAALDSKLVRLCDPEREEPCVTFELPARIYDVAFSGGDEARLGTVDGSGKLRLWETRTPQTLEAIRRGSRERAARLDPLIRQLFDEHLRLAAVQQAIDALPALSLEDRHAARVLAEARGDDAALTAFEALEILASRAAPEAYLLARCKLEVAHELEPDNRLWGVLLGTAHARLDKFDAALAALPDRSSLKGAAHIRRLALALRAKALAAVGRAQEAEEHAQALRELVAVQASWADDPRVAELLADVAQWLAEGTR